jgi:hypothetical protein
MFELDTHKKLMDIGYSYQVKTVPMIAEAGSA